MNALEKELTNRGKSATEAGEAIVKDVKLLLDSNAQEEISTLKSIGLDVDLRIAESKKEDIIIRGTANQKLDKQIVHIKEIRRFCLDYRLYMKPANQYAGRIPNDLGADLSRYCKEKNIVLTGSSIHSKFFIIAPPKMFVDYSSPGKVFVSAFEEAHKEVIERKRLREQDPILVYQLPESPNYYAVIKSWGNDFTPLRRLYGFLTQRKWFKKVLLVGDCLVLWTLFQIGLFSHRYLMGIGAAKDAEEFFGLATFVVWALLIMASGLYTFHGDIDKVRRHLIRKVTGVNEGGYREERSSRW